MCAIETKDKDGSEFQAANTLLTTIVYMNISSLVSNVSVQVVWKRMCVCEFMFLSVDLVR